MLRGQFGRTLAATRTAKTTTSGVRRTFSATARTATTTANDRPLHKGSLATAARLNQSKRWMARAKKESKPASGALELEVKQCKSYEIDPPPTTVITSKEELLAVYREMYVMRRFEIASDALYKSKMITGFCHLVNGQEGVCAGVEAALRPTDHIVTAYRDHGFYLTRGGTLRSAFAELIGRETGCARGRGGSMHMYSKENRFYGGNGIVGAQVPLGAGLAFTIKYEQKDEVAVTLYGDGAANQGQVFEAFNMAKLWSLPCIFICENNEYGMGTAAGRAAAEVAFYKRGGYIPGLKVDGMDVLAVKQATEFAAERARAGHGPMILEMHTYRYVGHSMSDPGTSYRTRDEVNQVRETRDPIQLTRKRLLENTDVTEEDLKILEKEARKEIDAALKEAKADSMPSLDTLFDHTYATREEEKNLRQVNYFGASMQK